jgi:hypothetical protein
MGTISSLCLYFFQRFPKFQKKNCGMLFHVNIKKDKHYGIKNEKSQSVKFFCLVGFKIQFFLKKSFFNVP